MTDLPAGGSERRSGSVRERLFDIALRQFRLHGYDAVPVSAITREGGVAKGTFFNYFATKDHLLAHFLRREVDEALDGTRTRRLAGTESILFFTRDLAGRLSRDRVLAESLIPRMGLLPAPDMGEDREEERIRLWIQARLGESLRVSVPLTEPDPSVLAALLVMAIRGSLEDWVREPRGERALRESIRARVGFLLESAGLPVDEPT